MRLIAWIVVLVPAVMFAQKDDKDAPPAFQYNPPQSSSSGVPLFQRNPTLFAPFRPLPGIGQGRTGLGGLLGGGFLSRPYVTANFDRYGRASNVGLAYPYGYGGLNTPGFGANRLGYGLSYGGLGYGSLGLGGYLGNAGVLIGPLQPRSWNPEPPVGTYANPAPVRPVDDLPEPLAAPERPEAVADGASWTDARMRFDSASAEVSAARREVEELRARLEAIGQSPRANLDTRVASAEAALEAAQTSLGAGALEEALSETTRATYLARQVLKEFGR